MEIKEEFQHGDTAMVITSTNGTAKTVDVASLAIPYEVVDDDTGAGDVAAPDTSNLALRLGPAYVVPLYDIGDNNTNVAFELNVQPNAGQLSGYDFDQFATENAPHFWTIYLLGAYQPETWFSIPIPPFTFGDGDAASEGQVTLGIVDAIGIGQGAREFKESFNEIPCSSAQVMAHEVGHLFDGDHNDGALMTGMSCPLPGWVFAPMTLHRIRMIPNP